MTTIDVCFDGPTTNSTKNTVLAGKQKTSSSEWVLFCSLVPNVISLIIIILAEIYTSYDYILLIIGYVFSFGLFLWLLMYDPFFIKNGYKIGLFEKIRVPLNKKNRIPEGLEVFGFLYLFMQTAIELVINFFPKFYLYFDLILIAIVIFFIHEIWHVDEIKSFLLHKSNNRINPPIQ